MASPKERAKCVLWLAELNCLSEVRKKYTDHFNKEAPHSNSISEWMIRFKETGSVNGESEDEMPQITEEISTTEEKSIENSPPIKRAKHTNACKSLPKRPTIPRKNAGTKENVPYVDPLLITTDIPVPITSKPEEKNIEKPKKTSLRNLKFRMSPLVVAKTPETNSQIKQEIPDYDDSNDNTDTYMDSVPGCSTSIVNNDTISPVFVKIENIPSVPEVVEGDSEMMPQLPVKCLMQETFSCDHCSFTTLYERKFKRHVADHYMQTKFSCEMCPFIARHRAVLISHMLTHTKIKRLSCEFCPFESRTKGEFRAHILTHTQPYKCQVCLYETDSESLLSSHMLACCVLIRPKKKGFFDEDDDDITSETV